MCSIVGSYRYLSRNAKNLPLLFAGRGKTVSSVR